MPGCQPGHNAALWSTVCAGQVVGQHAVAGLSGHWGGCFVGSPPFPCLNPEVFQSLSVSQI